jgi:hypothetical protein
LGRPIGGNLFAPHAPDFFSVGLEKDPKETLSKLVGNPILEILRVLHREEARLPIGENTQDRLQDAEFKKRLKSLKWVGKISASVINPARTGAIQKVILEKFCPKILNFPGFGKESVPANIEPIALVLYRSGDTTHILRVSLENVWPKSRFTE